MRRENRNPFRLYFVEFVIAVVLSVASGVVVALIKGRKD